MPTFKLNKLVRDKLREEYAHMGQKAVYRVISPEEHKTELRRKIIEEAQEIKIDGPAQEIIDEIVDVRQGLDDLMALYDITEEQIKVVQKDKYTQKGGFAAGTFVETIELDEGDDWVDYYRQRPDKFPEV